MWISNIQLELCVSMKDDRAYLGNVSVVNLLYNFTTSEQRVDAISAPSIEYNYNHIVVFM